MKQTSRIISTYAADISGVPSALFELGGMTVMHDASGCNSTYNTHDEPRWYDHDSMVFLSGMTEMDAIMGGDDKLIHDVCAAANELHPRFIAIAGTPIPMMIGTDFDAVARVIEERTGIPCLGLKTNSMHSYLSGAGMAFTAYAKRFVDRTLSRQAGSGRVNVLGLTPLDFSVNGSNESIRQLLQRGGLTPLSSWAMGSSPDELARSGLANVNLVVSYAGLSAAKYLKRTFGAPYVVGVPIGKEFSGVLINALHKASKTGECSAPCALRRADGAAPQISIVGESVYSGSLAAAIEAQTGLSCRVICPLETEKALMGFGDCLASDEDELIPLLYSGIVVADPLYKPICGGLTRFYELPSEAFSGRIYRKSIPNLIGKRL